MVEETLVFKDFDILVNVFVQLEADAKQDIFLDVTLFRKTQFCDKPSSC